MWEKQIINYLFGFVEVITDIMHMTCRIMSQQDGTELQSSVDPSSQR
jgi:hypothetical protein